MNPIRRGRSPRFPDALVACVALLVAVAVAPACGWFGDDDLAPMELAGKGEVEIVRDGETFRVEGVAMIEPGDVVRTGADGSARLRLEGDRRAELAPSSELEVLGPAALESLRGDLLARGSDPIRVALGRLTVRGQAAAFRVDRNFGSSRVAAYDGSVVLGAPFEAPLTIRGLFEAQLAAGAVPTGIRPYGLDPRDRWDQALLGDVIELDRELTSLADGLAAQLGRRRASPAVLRRVSGGRPIGYVRPYLRYPLPDLLIGLSLARSAPAGPPGRTFARAFDLREQGARWGIVAEILAVPSKPLIARLERLIGGRVADDGGAITLAGGDESGGSFDPGPGDPRDPDPRTTPPEDDDPTPKPSRSPPPSPPPCENEVDCIVGEVLPSPTPVP